MWDSIRSIRSGFRALPPAPVLCNVSVSIRTCLCFTGIKKLLIYSPELCWGVQREGGSSSITGLWLWCKIPFGGVREKGRGLGWSLLCGQSGVGTVPPCLQPRVFGSWDVVPEDKQRSLSPSVGCAGGAAGHGPLSTETWAVKGVQMSPWPRLVTPPGAGASLRTEEGHG